MTGPDPPSKSVFDGFGNTVLSMPPSNTTGTTAASTKAVYYTADNTSVLRTTKSTFDLTSRATPSTSDCGSYCGVDDHRARFVIGVVPGGGFLNAGSDSINKLGSLP